MSHQRQPHRRPHLGRPGPHRPLLLPGRDHQRQPGPEFPKCLPAPVVELHGIARTEQHPNQGGIALGGGDQPVGDAPKPVGGGDAADPLVLQDQPRRPALGLAEDLIEKRLLPIEVPIDRSLGHPGPGRDRRRGRRVVALGGEQFEGGANQATAGGDGIATGPGGRICHGKESRPLPGGVEANWMIR